MIERLILAALSTAILTALATQGTWTAAAQDAGTVIANASKAMGVDTLKTVQYSATGFDFALGQAPNPSSPWPKFINKSYTRAIDFETPASRVDRVRVQGENPPRGGGQQPIVGEQPQSQTIIVARRHAVGAAARDLDDAARLPARGGGAERDRRSEDRRRQEVQRRQLHRRQQGQGQRLHQRPEPGRARRDLDRQRRSSATCCSRRSTATTRTSAARSSRCTSCRSRAAIRSSTCTSTDVKANAAVKIQPPQGRGGAAPAAARPRSHAAQSEKLGDGVYLITGGYAVDRRRLQGSHRDHRGGQSEARGLAVIAEAKRLIPDKPIKYVVNTHSHIDHSSGLRAFVAEGATILTHQLNKAYLEKTLSLPHTLNPDKAQQAGEEADRRSGRRKERADRRQARRRAVPHAELRASRRDADRVSAEGESPARGRRLQSAGRRRRRRRRRRARTPSAWSTTSSA